MSATLRKGDRGKNVRRLQEVLNARGATLTVDGDFGPATEAAVEDFQESAGLFSDGIVGRRTWAALGMIDPDPPRSVEFGWTKVPADRYREGYDSFRLRDDVAERYLGVREQVVAAGAILPSSGGRRSLTAHVSANRAATSLHYLGRALDLYVYAAMVDPDTDPIVVQPHPDRDRAWIVYARADAGQYLTFDAMTYQRKAIETSGCFVNLTELFRSAGFASIRARKSFYSSAPNTNNGSAEWWHFQNEEGLVRDVTTFGSELLRVYTPQEVDGTPPWKYRDRTFKDGWF